MAHTKRVVNAIFMYCGTNKQNKLVLEQIDFVAKNILVGHSCNKIATLLRWHILGRQLIACNMLDLAIHPTQSRHPVLQTRKELLLMLL